MHQDKQNGPKVIGYFEPIIDALKELGGSGRPTEVEDIIASRLRLSSVEREDLTSSGASRYSKQVHWARFYLVRAGYLDASVRGVWTLTDKGRSVVKLSQTDCLSIFSIVTEQLKKEKIDSQAETSEHLVDENESPITDVRDELLESLRALPPNGFERLCQRLLRESGFERVSVTGRSGDGGIDGIGVLQMTAFVSFKVLFQCKRYSGSVGSAQIRDFRGAMQGRADKGIILTTGTFTGDAKTEATRDGVVPIELVDGQKLVDLFESLELGLKPRTTYDIDHEFFREFS